MTIIKPIPHLYFKTKRFYKDVGEFGPSALLEKAIFY